MLEVRGAVNVFATELILINEISVEVKKQSRKLKKPGLHFSTETLIISIQAATAVWR